MPPDDDVVLGVIEHVAHVEDTRHIRRRDHDRERSAGVFCACSEDSVFNPPLRPRRLKSLRLIDFIDLGLHGREL